MIKDAKSEAASTEAQLRALAVAAGLATEQQASEWIHARPGRIVPLEIGISTAMPVGSRNALFALMQSDSGTVN